MYCINEVIIYLYNNWIIILYIIYIYILKYIVNINIIYNKHILYYYMF